MIEALGLNIFIRILGAYDFMAYDATCVSIIRLVILIKFCRLLFL